jgi:hypothetical protein
VLPSLERLSESFLEPLWSGCDTHRYAGLMQLSPFIRETADRVLKSAAQGYLAAWFLSSGGTGDFDHLFTVLNLKAAAVAAVLSAAMAFGLKFQGSDRNTSQVI